MCSEYAWKMLCDWQTLAAGILAIVAAVIGGLFVYLAGVKQANATREATERRIELLERQNAFEKNQRIVAGVLPGDAKGREAP